MKKLVLLVVLVAFAYSAHSQKLIKNRMDSIAYDLAYTKYNLGKYHKQWKTGFLISFAGVAVSGLSVALGPVKETQTGLVRNAKGIVEDGVITTYNYTPMYVGIIIGSAISAVGTIISIDANKWIRRASLKPSNYGVSFTYDIDKEFE